MGVTVAIILPLTYLPVTINPNRMKALYLLIFACILLCLNSCLKDSTLPYQSGSLIGKWNIVSDSTYVGVGYNNHPVDYAGKPGDYFNFTSNGIIYTKEGDVLDTLSYSLSADTGIVISSFGAILNGVPAVSKFKNFTDHSLIIASPVALTPGGIFSRKVYLSR